MTYFKRFESKPVVKIIYIYTHCNLWRHRQFITIFYQFLHIRIEIIHGSHMYILFLPRVGLYVSFLPLANARGTSSWHKGLPVVKPIYTYELFLKFTSKRQRYPDVTFIGRSKKYHSTAGYGPLHTHFRVWVLLIVEEPIMTEMQNLISISVILNGFSCSFTSIFFFFFFLLIC